MRAISNFDTGFPNMRGRDHHASAATIAEVLRDERLRHLRRRQVAPRRHGRMLGRRAVRQLAAARRASTATTGSSRGRPTSSIPSSTSDNHFVEPPSRPEEGYHFSEDLVDHPPGWSTTRPRWSRAPLLPLPGVRRDARAAPGAAGLSREVPRPLRRRLGRGARDLVRAAAGDGHRSRRTPSSPRTIRASRPWADLPRQPAAPRRPAAGGVRRHARAHRRPDRPAGRRSSKSVGRSTTPCSSSCPTTGPARRAGPSASWTR